MVCSATLPVDVWVRILQFTSTLAAHRCCRVNQLLSEVAQTEILSDPARLLQAVGYDLRSASPLPLGHPSDPAYPSCDSAVSLEQTPCARLGDVYWQLAAILAPRDHSGAVAAAIPAALSCLARAAQHLPPQERRRMAGAARLAARSMVPLLCVAHAYSEQESYPRGGRGACAVPHPVLTHVHSVLLIGHRAPRAVRNAAGRPGTAATAASGIDVEAILAGTTAVPEAFPGPWHQHENQVMEVVERVKALVEAAGEGVQLMTICLQTRCSYRHREMSRLVVEWRAAQGLDVGDDAEGASDD